MAKVYSNEFKAECASLYLDSDLTMKEICYSRKCSVSALRKWIEEEKNKRMREDISKIPDGDPVDWGEDEKEQNLADLRKALDERNQRIGDLRKSLDEWMIECQEYIKELEIYKRQYSILKNALAVVLNEPNL